MFSEVFILYRLVYFHEALGCNRRDRVVTVHGESLEVDLISLRFFLKGSRMDMASEAQSLPNVCISSCMTMPSLKQTGYVSDTV